MILVGPSKAGKSRSAFHTLLADDRWRRAVLIAPTTGGLAQLARHPRLTATTDPVVIWLDEINRYLTAATASAGGEAGDRHGSALSNALTVAVVNALTSRPGPTLLIGTLLDIEDSRIENGNGEFDRDPKYLPRSATRVRLLPTSDDLDETAASQHAYPQEDLAPVRPG